MNIIDKVLEPYYINLTSDNYDVLERTGNIDKKGNEIVKCHGHFSSVENALNKINKLDVEINKTYDLKGYLDALKESRIKIELNNNK